MERWHSYRSSLTSAARYALPGFAMVLLVWTYFAGVRYFPQPTGDESSLLDIPYRFCQFHDFRYPATWSQSFGSGEVRKYPPISAFLMRSVYHGLVGFSAVSSRVFSGLLVLSVVLSSILLLRRLGGRPSGSGVFLLLCQLGLTPVLSYNARTTRFEQEIFFLGAWGCVALPCLMASISARWGQALCWLVMGLALALASTSHPFGIVFPVAGACWYVFCFRWRGQLDHLTRWRRLAWLGAGLVLGLLPTVLWFAWDPANTIRFTHALSTIYAARAPDMVAYLANLPPWHCVSRFAPSHWAARLNALDTAAYLDYAGYPVANYRFRFVLHGWFYVQAATVLGFFLYSVFCRFRNAVAWTHLPVWLAVGFVGCMVCYTPPNTTYNLYPAFFVSLAFFAAVWSLWCQRQRLGLAGRLLTTGACGCLIVTSLLDAHYAMVHVRRVTRTLARHGEPTICLDQEFHALRQMAARVGLDRPDETVYTSTESWIAAGRDNRALLETVALGQDSPGANVDGVVFNTTNMQYFINSFCKNIAEPFPNPPQRAERLRALLSEVRLSGIVLDQLNPATAFLFYTRPHSGESSLEVATMARGGRTDKAIAHLMYHQGEGLAGKPMSLPAGRYLLLAWADTNADGEQVQVHVRHSQRKPASSTLDHTVALQPLNAVFPAVLSFAVPADDCLVCIRMKSGSLSMPCRHAELYRVTSR